MNELIELVTYISREMHSLKAFVKWQSRKFSERFAHEWVDGDQVMRILKISRGTMQNLRDRGTLPYSQVSGKFYYKAEDLVNLLESNYVKRIARIEDELHEGH